jgi:hypothetical protein
MPHLFFQIKEIGLKTANLSSLKCRNVGIKFHENSFRWFLWLKRVERQTNVQQILANSAE